ncbi:MAG: DUF1957 domain-containing protein [Chloroflexi bacterium]|nr:DUF1957 domain-containing protein [Chloroflexota bacterium]
MNEIRLALLGLLHQSSLDAFQIRRLESEQQGLWAEVPLSSIYHELARLIDEGLVEREVVAPATPEQAPSKRYRLTAAGSQALRSLLSQAWSEAGSSSAVQDLTLLNPELISADGLVSALTKRIDNLERELERADNRCKELSESDDNWPLVRTVHDRLRERQTSELAWVRSLLEQIKAGHWRMRPRPDSSGRLNLAQRIADKRVGAFTFVLHSHLPYCRMSGRWPHGEEWLHEALAETYVPLLETLFDMAEDQVPFQLTIGLTPVLTEQLADMDVREHFIIYLEEKIDAASADIERFEASGEEQLKTLAIFYHDYYTHVGNVYNERLGGDVIGAFKRLQDAGLIELITSAATHGYLPLLVRDSSIYGQIQAGIESYRRHFGRSPRTIWLPECAYRPAYRDENGLIRPGLEEFLAGAGLSAFLVETHAIEGGQPVGKAADEVSIGPYGAVMRDYLVAPRKDFEGGGTTYRAYYTASQNGLTDPPVAVIGRNNRTGQQVWSAQFGYPGDGQYREFHRKDSESGLQYWRITGSQTDLGNKEIYQPWEADQRIDEHAWHYAGLVHDLLLDYANHTGDYGLISSNYDTELFGHWWFEGVRWLGKVLRILAASEQVELTTISKFVTVREPTQMLAVPESSWGSGGYHWTWDNDDTRWMWAPIHAAEKRMEALVERFPNAEGEVLRALNQAARELLLLQSSDWPFLVTTSQAHAYAIKRFNGHVERFNQLADLLQGGAYSEAGHVADTLYEQDKVFSTIDYRWFAERQGKAK